MKTTEVEFTLQAYEELVERDKTHALFTKAGEAARIVCKDKIGIDSLVVLVTSADGDECAEGYRVDGRYYGTPGGDDLVLRMLAPKSLGWINVWQRNDNVYVSDRLPYVTQEEAMNIPTTNVAARVACVELFKGQGL